MSLSAFIARPVVAVMVGLYSFQHNFQTVFPRGTAVSPFLPALIVGVGGLPSSSIFDYMVRVPCPKQPRNDHKVCCCLIFLCVPFCFLLPFHLNFRLLLLHFYPSDRFPLCLSCLFLLILYLFLSLSPPSFSFFPLPPTPQQSWTRWGGRHEQGWRLE